MDFCVSRPRFGWLLLLILCCFLANLDASAVELNPPKLYPDGKIGVIGDSMAAGTHSSQMCGSADAYQCLNNLMGSHNPDWSYLGGSKRWSIASRLGFKPGQVVDASGDGEAWRDALQQAVEIIADPKVEAVLIGLGANDVCAPRGHDYAGDLQRIALHIDETLSLLTDRLPAGGRIYWSAAPDVVQLRDTMASRDHNYWFESCQATWDLNGDNIKDGAARDVCDHFYDHDACRLSSVQEEAKDEIVDLLLSRWLDANGIGEGPCGKVLSSKSSAEDLDEARQFNAALNSLMARKAAEFNGRQGVSVYYSDAVARPSASFQPYYLSRLDCFHPNRTGQMWLADQVWKGFDSDDNPIRKMAIDEFDSQDYCTQALTSWDSCWTEINDGGSPTSGDVRINVQELRIRDNDRGVWRALDLEGSEQAWVSFNWRREGLDRSADYVAFSVSPDGGQSWTELDRVAGDGDDFSMHRGDDYDISPYAGADTRIRFLAASGLGGEDIVYIDNVKLVAWGGPRASDVLVDFGASGLWAYLNDSGWLKLNNASPDRMLLTDIDGDGDDDVIGDFSSTSGGIAVQRDRIGGWDHLHPFPAEGFAVGDLDDNGKADVIIDFGVTGLWAWMNDSAWLKLNNRSPERLTVGDMDGNGQDDVIAAFGTAPSGIFVKRNLGAWSMLHNSDAETLAVADLDNSGKDDVVIDFGGIGLWARMNDATWLKLHNGSPELISSGDVDGNGADDLLATFSGAPGLWLKKNLGGWSRISAGTPQQVATGDVDANGTNDIVADFGSGGAVSGLFIRRNETAWRKLHNSSPQDYALGNLD